MPLNNSATWRRRLIIVAMITLGFAKAASAQTLLHDLKEIGPYVSRCWVTPSGKPPGVTVEMTVSFALRSDGTVIGTPTLTYFSPRAFTGLREKYRNSALKMLEACAPVPLSAALGSRIAGRPNRLRLIHDDNIEEESPAWRSTLKTPSSWRPRKVG